MVEPGQGSLDHVAETAQSRAVGGVGGSRQPGDHPAFAGLVDIDLPTIAPIARVFIRPMSGSTGGTDHRWDGIQQGDRQRAIGLVGSGDFEGQGQPLGINDQVAFTALLAPVRRVGTGVRPPKRRGTKH